MTVEGETDDYDFGVSPVEFGDCEADNADNKFAGREGTTAL